MNEADVNTVILILRFLIVGMMNLFVVEGVVKVVFMISWGHNPRSRCGIWFKGLKEQVTLPSVILKEFIAIVSKENISIIIF